MNMQQSFEIRWFFKKEENREQVLDWLYNVEGGIDNPENERTDFYLNHFFKGTLGIKLRGEQLEIKEKVAHKVKHHKWDDLGKIEIYNKLEFNSASKDAIVPKQDEYKKHEHWIALKKKRKLIKIDTGHALRIYPGNEIIPDGCSVEVTNLELNDEHWWTFCIEAYAKEKDIYNNLDEVLCYITKTFSNLKHIVKPRASMGYPFWLHSINNF
jgi:hypothetical protein